MENKIPLPTDNVFKFYALFGLLLFVFSVGASIYLNRSTNELLFAAIPKIATLIDPKSTERQTLEKKVEVAIDDRETFQWALALLMTLSLGATTYGFTQWHGHIQPQQDELARVQLEIAKLQLAKLRRELHSLNESVET